MIKHRRQTDKAEQDRLREATMISTGTISKVRQELGPDTNINNILKKFGVNAPQRQGIYGQTIDYNMDLASAQSIISEATTAYQQLPEKLRARYRSLEEFRRGMESGAIKPADLQDERQLQLDLKREQEKEVKERSEKGRITGKDPDDESLRKRNNKKVDTETDNE